MVTMAREVRQAIIDAAEFVGEELVINPEDSNTPRGITAFLANVAREHPAVMCGMLARLVPIQEESTQTVGLVDETERDFDGFIAARCDPLVERIM
jgi:hypothetical protein